MVKFLGILHFICEKTERRHTLETKSTTLKLKVGTRQPKWPPSILAKQSHTRPRLSVDRVPPLVTGLTRARFCQTPACVRMKRKTRGKKESSDWLKAQLRHLL